MPPSGFSARTVKGLLTFVKGNYEDLLKEVKDGKHPDVKAAIQHEVTQLGKALSELHINKAGKLVKRKR